MGTVKNRDILCKSGYSRIAGLILGLFFLSLNDAVYAASASPPPLVCHSAVLNYYTSPAEPSALAACNDFVNWYNAQWRMFAVNLISCNPATQTMVVGSWFAPPSSYFVSCKQDACPAHASGTPCVCDAGYVFNSTKTACVTLQLSVTPSVTYIPVESRVQNKRVLTQSDLALNLQKGNEPASGITVRLQASRTAGAGAGQDTINGPATPTDAKGNAAANISTRDQPGTAVVMASDTANIQTITPGVVHWFPADYQSGFLVTCYYVAVEANWSAQSTKNNVCGLPPKQAYRSGFLADTRMQGTGITVDGQYIHYDNKRKCYNPQKCALTASGACATAGTTIAVDPSIIPRGKLGSQVAIDILGGQRTAQDGGGWINLYHIDNFTGLANQACKDFGKQHSKITFLKY